MTMKIVVKKELFQQALSNIQGIVEKKSTFPVLSHVLLKAEEMLSLQATDLEIAFTKKLKDAEIIEEGSLCIPAKKLYDLVRELPAQKEIRIEGKENFWSNIRLEGISLELPGIDPKDFPKIDDEERGESFNFSLPEIKSMIEKTIFAASVQESRFNLNGVYMEAVEKDGERYLRFVATDGHRLSLIDRKMEEGGLSGGVIIPRRGLTELRRIASEGSVRIRLKANKIEFSGEDFSLIIRLLEGEFPDYKHVIPSINDKILTAPRRDLVSALRRAHVIASEKGEGVHFSIKEKEMVMRAGGADTGQMTENLPVQYEGEPLEINFNARYLLEALNVMEGDEVRIELRDEESAALMRPLADQDHLYVIMPMRMQV